MDTGRQLSEAIVVWTGWGDTAWPARDNARLVARFGDDLAASLAPGVRRLHDAFYETDAHHRIGDLKEMGDTAAAEFRASHPELSDDAVHALAWCYTFDWK